ncbi:MAG: efflux RND transporter periplasmic adaptor subunit [Pseudomonadota bacterium]|jgi:RND family efflux transporter MFP subunit|uniref:efflux RND transporter periplasmic adaptor subunit n=1 Tax=unclassified Pseudoalteromonas TaxID=194690 RepID=UPI00048F6E89|nr:MULTISPECIES: efflux RND transporter periplasmic adaptor subunit [unclassified Pseudoalteromonas]KGK02885.1 efflux transporter, RND family, MFP subunit [Pseudoalteromonas sp. ND6B]MDN3413065.1 efflux RND transporter periplasmic adaptor subunit [Pseudoalteromonas sp. APC 3250]MDN3490881.1 efflux RND transporter periplasmic adaptor subunit [Pseudoalteromonas sp. APC 3694]
MKLNKQKIIVPAAIIIATIFLVMFIKGNPPKASRFSAPPKAKINVAVKPLQLIDYPVEIDSFGTVKPRTQSMLVAQVSGLIIDINEQFREGGFFEKGDVLLQLDDRDLKAEVKSAQANLLNAEQNLLEEQARGRQALTDWQRLGNESEPSILVLRKPQLAAAQAQVLSAQAQLEKAQLNLERTKIKAPYAGRVLNRSVDLGQVVSNNMQLATIYATDSVEIRLPIKNKDLPFINLPEQYRDGAKNQRGSAVNFTSDLIGEQQWQGQLIRTEGAIDESAQQLYVVAKINDPYKSTSDNQYPVKIGQYVKAKINGKVASQVLVIPNSAIYQGSYVYVVENGTLQRKNIALAWQNALQGIVSKGLEAGSQLVLTPLGQVSSGTPVQIMDATPKAQKPGEQP